MEQLLSHNCINLRLPTHGGLYAWEFERGGRELKVRVEGQLVFNMTNQMLVAALTGLGLAYVPEDPVETQPFRDRPEQCRPGARSAQVAAAPTPPVHSAK
ncbi:MAG: transcriptional regulator [Gammaproteobacteria bacterium]|nr:transcriptional regulator [Gammaproteobacteria bacterium]